MLLVMLLTIIPLGASAALAKEKVLSTDIGCLVNMQPIYSFNVNNETYVVAEDLRSYGFDVVWEA